MTGPSPSSRWSSVPWGRYASSVELAAHKPVLINTYHLASLDEGIVSRIILQAKQLMGGRIGNDGGSVFATAAGVVGGLGVQRLEDASSGYVVARIALMGEGGPSIDVRIPLPPAVSNALSEGSRSLVSSAVEAIQSMAVSTGQAHRWE